MARTTADRHTGPYMRWLETVARALLLSWVAAAGILYIIRTMTFPTESFSASLWNYFASDPLKNLTVLLVFPALLMLVERRLDLVGAMAQRRQAERQRLEEKRQARRAWRLECVAKTAAMWNELYALTSEVQNFPLDSDPDGQKINAIRTRLHNFSSTAEDVINMWSVRLNNLHFVTSIHQNNPSVDPQSASAPQEPDTTPMTGADIFLVFINMQILSVDAVSRAIRDGAAKEEVQELQASLELLQGAFLAIAHHAILDVLKLSVDLMDEDSSAEKREKTEQQIQTYLTYLQDWVNRLKKAEHEYAPLLPTLDDSVAGPVRLAGKAVLDQLRSSQTRQVDHEKYDQIHQALEDVPRPDRIRSVLRTYSAETVNRLAESLVTDQVCWGLIDTAQWLRHTPPSAEDILLQDP